MSKKKNISQKFRLKQKNYFIEEIEQNELIRKKHKKICKTLIYTQHLLILASSVTGCASISAFASLIDIPPNIESSAVGIKICVVTAAKKQYKSTVKEKNTIKYKKSNSHEKNTIK